MCFISPTHEKTGTTVYDKKTNQFEFLPVQGQTGKRSQVAAKGKRMQYDFFFHIHLKHNFNSVSFVNYYFGLFFLTYNVILY